VERRRIRGFAKRISLLVEWGGRGRGGNTDGKGKGKNHKKDSSKRAKEA
jgi:hypothetical protein